MVTTPMIPVEAKATAIGMPETSRTTSKPTRSNPIRTGSMSVLSPAMRLKPLGEDTDLAQKIEQKLQGQTCQTKSDKDARRPDRERDGAGGLFVLKDRVPGEAEGELGDQADYDHRHCERDPSNDPEGARRQQSRHDIDLEILPLLLGSRHTDVDLGHQQQNGDLFGTRYRRIQEEARRYVESPLAS